ncbi:hypothetical protein PG994_014634 [Apiospora phragmitis]|uniref:C2 NT-type domain-containing protein n=1 Tax=Apiospora phragmitis TaxID=2905665 RepID=A0ABR1T4W4_9PEZI
MPTNDGVVGSREAFCQEATSVVVAFKVHDGQEHVHDRDADAEGTRYKLRMAFKANYQPPIVTLRFHVNIFGHDDDGKKEKTTLYFDVPPHHISSLAQTHHIDTTEMDQDELQHFAGGVTRVRFLLQRPGNLVQPVRDLALKPASQRTLASMISLAAVLDFVLFMPQNTLSKDQFRCLEQAVTSPTSRHDLQQRNKERDWWLGALYGGVGGKLVDVAAVDDDSTASDSGDSTIATATPPAYRRSAPDEEGSDADASDAEDGDAADDEDASDAADAVAADDLDADSPPPYDQLDSDAGDAAAVDMKGKQPGKRLRDSPDPDVQLYRRRLFSPIAEASCCEKLESNPVALVLSKLEQVLQKAQATEEENKSLRAELSAMRQRQDQLEDMVRRHDKRTQDLEVEGADLDSRVNGLEERQAELEECQGKTEDKCDAFEVDIADQVHSALRDRLIGALETM